MSIIFVCDNVKLLCGGVGVIWVHKYKRRRYTGIIHHHSEKPFGVKVRTYEALQVYTHYCLQLTTI
jgi:hypothetical protein